MRRPRYFSMYAGMLAEVETDLRNRNDVNVHLATADPVEDTESAAVAAA